MKNRNATHESLQYKADNSLFQVKAPLAGEEESQQVWAAYNQLAALSLAIPEGVITLGVWCNVVGVAPVIPHGLVHIAAIVQVVFAQNRFDSLCRLRKPQFSSELSPYLILEALQHISDILLRASKANE